ncbi:uncharacterized protein [Anoplolepis gracilipes]|uniref:uncharacterized protein n=1 Tax=Anoplolepis gracilipes TaxID=354296 RepID=UPI003BA32842
MKGESVIELRKVFHRMKSTVSALASINRPISSCEDLFVYLAVELLDARSRREWENSISETVEPPSYKALEQFLDRRLHTLEAICPIKTERPGAKPESKPTRSHHARKQEARPESVRGQCSLCQKNHFVMICDAYKRKSAFDRKLHIEQNSMCLNCLGRHKVDDCGSKKNCTACGKRHHTSLHDAFRGSENVTTANVAPRVANNNSVVLLRAGPRGRSTWQLVELASRSGSSRRIRWVDGQKTGTVKRRVNIKLAPRGEGPAITLAVLILPKLTAYAGSNLLGAPTWKHIEGIPLADPDYHSVDLILAANVYSEILLPGLRKGASKEPVAQNTSLGWILSGAAHGGPLPSTMYSHQCQVDDGLSAMVRRLWVQEELPAASPPLSKAEIDCEEHYVRTHSRKSDGRYIVRLPLAAPLPDLSDTRRLALHSLKRMEARFERDPSFRSLYREFMEQYTEFSHMTPMPARSDCKEVCYLPHHGVLQKSSTTTKLRVVFNGSATMKTGAALNQYLHCGPNLLPCLADILLQWRRHRYVIAADIEKMYRSEDNVQEYQLNTVTCGLACALFLAIRTLHQLVEDEKAFYPLGAAVFLKEVYMDDILTDAFRIEDARDLLKQLTGICRAGGFPLKKWSANNSALLDGVPVEDRLQREPRWWLPGESHSTLGLLWHLHEDLFSFAPTDNKLDVVTKKAVLSLTARLFDLLGWLSPVTICAKILIQATWLLSVQWDDPLPEEDDRQWRNFQTELPLLGEIRLPRWMSTGATYDDQEIHSFADALEKAFTAVVYLRTRDRDNKTKVTLIAVKTKVAPLKKVTLSRLELCAATLLTRLVAISNPC